MSTKINHLLTAALLLIMILGGCQKEIDETIETTTEEVFSSESPVASLIQKTSLRDGSADNIIDGSSCSSLKLPITVEVNGLEVMLDSEEDFETVENIIDKFDDDEDLIEFIYPVKVILADHSEVIIENEDVMEELLDDCVEGGADDDIECIDFKYPISIAVFNSDNQLSNVVTIDSDKLMHDFIHDLKESDVASINFPVTVILSDDSELTINDHDELEDVLKNAISDCDEDDDNDHNEDDVDDTELFNVLLNSEWIITYFFDDKDETSDFNGYVFAFFEDGKVKAKKGDIIIEGSWFSNGDDGELELELDFGDDAPLDELNDDWDLIEFAELIVKLKDISGGDGSEEYLTFEKYHDTGGDSQDLSDILTTGEWLVANYNDSGEDNTSNYNDFKFTFSSDGNVTALKGDDKLSGSWSISTNDGVEKLTLDFDSVAPLDEFNDDWDIADKKENRIELKDVSGGDGSVDKLVFELIP